MMSDFEGGAALPQAHLTFALDGRAAAAEAPVVAFADDGRDTDRLAGRAADWELPMSRE
jgi:hypothetical protein